MDYDATLLHPGLPPPATRAIPNPAPPVRPPEGADLPGHAVRRLRLALEAEARLIVAGGPAGTRRGEPRA